MKTLHQILTEMAHARADALAMIEAEGFRFTSTGEPPRNDAERWEKLAFSLYTDIAAMSAAAEEALYALEPDKVSDEEWQRRHS
jgi:hypothetical protein